MLMAPIRHNPRRNSTPANGKWTWYRSHITVSQKPFSSDTLFENGPSGVCHYRTIPRGLNYRQALAKFKRIKKPSDIYRNVDGYSECV
jgi:hypothetical protein